MQAGLHGNSLHPYRAGMLLIPPSRYCSDNATGMTKYITGRSGLTSTVVDITGRPHRPNWVSVCKYYIGPSVPCLCCLPLPFLLSGVLFGGGRYMTAPPPLVPGR